MSGEEAGRAVANQAGKIRQFIETEPEKPSTDWLHELEGELGRGSLLVGSIDGFRADCAMRRQLRSALHAGEAILRRHSRRTSAPLTIYGEGIQ